MGGDAVTDPTVNFVDDTAVPDAVVTAIVPVVAPAGTGTLNDVPSADALESKRFALTPLNFTEVTPVKPLPYMVTVLPVAAVSGQKAEMLVPIVRLTVEVVEPSAVTVSGPVWAPVGTTAVTWVSDTTVTPALDGADPVKVTAVVFARSAPV